MRKTPLIFIAAALPMAVNAANTEFSYGGYIKLDVIASEMSDGQLGPDNVSRNFYIPGGTPTSNGSGKSSSALEYHMKQTRFNFKTVTDLENGDKVTGFIEMDFYGGGTFENERVSNSNSPRLRHAFIKTGKWTFGQTWTTLMNTGALVESVDFIGISDSTPFVRQAMVRYTNGGLVFALENAETTVTDATGARQISDTSNIPDIVAKYNLKAGDHSFSVAAIGRSLKYKTANNSVDESTSGFGVSFAGKLSIGAADSLKVGASNGALGRYVGLNTANDAALIGGKLESISLTSAYAGYQHKWNSQMRTNLIHSMLTIDNDKKAAGDPNKEASSTRINLMYQPAKALTYGIELSKATLKKESGNDGDQTRLHFMAKYAF